MSLLAGAEEAQKQRAIETHSRQAVEFEQGYASLEDAPYRDCFAYSRHRLQDALARQLPARGGGLRLLDVGCGTGHHMAALRARGFEVAGVDGSPEMLASARRLNPDADVRQADVERLPHPDASFDVVLSIEVLRYLPRPAASLREMRRVLKPGGVCLVTAAPRFSLQGYWLVNRLATRVRVSDLVPLRQYFITASGLRGALRKAGFEDVQVHGVYTGPVNWVERLLPSLLPFALAGWRPIDGVLADLPLLRGLSNMFLARGRAPAPPAPPHA